MSQSSEQQVSSLPGYERKQARNLLLGLQFARAGVILFWLAVLAVFFLLGFGSHIARSLSLAETTMLQVTLRTIAVSTWLSIASTLLMIVAAALFLGAPRRAYSFNLAIMFFVAAIGGVLLTVVIAAGMEQWLPLWLRIAASIAFYSSPVLLMLLTLKIARYSESEQGRRLMIQSIGYTVLSAVVVLIALFGASSSGAISAAVLLCQYS
jgi:hypothetical protein